MGTKAETSFSVFTCLHTLPCTFEGCTANPQGWIFFALHDGSSDVQFPLLLMAVVHHITARGICSSSELPAFLLQYKHVGNAPGYCYFWRLLAVKICAIKNLLQAFIILITKNYTEFLLFTAEPPVLYTVKKPRKTQATKFKVDP